MRVYVVSRLTQIQQTDLVLSRLETMVSKLTAFKEFQPVMLRSFFSARSASTLAVVLLTLLCADVASAQEVGGGRALIDLSASFGVGLVVIGAAMGISKLAAAAYESMARQPEVSGSIQTALIIAAALIEGFTFYALFICSGK